MYTGLHVPDDLVAPAKSRFETVSVENRDIATTVTDQFPLLQGAGGLGDADPPHARHMREKLAENVKTAHTVEITLLALTLVLSNMTFSSSRTNVLLGALLGAVHLLVFFACLLLIFQR